ncbi:MAG: hypothetical protein GTN89_04960, partial [Acidobacteria bacterium]|nr:hypothetical protein [Acidobacteriota bacterium]NIM62258.1 hypothetical protein [Acidobacteriota bacterium]NIO58664.1 hypothetical protein [Acidobacteriota bacterium]NIQ29720.1 hypothetical protein [Acidobacteriota bacterium]NIQ84444.1 hypothetical protein [Acidobacteriota bacterium]
LRTIRAFLWMRWRVSRNAFRVRRRDSLEQISRALGALAPFFLLLMLVPTVVFLGAMGLFLGWKMGAAGTVLIWESVAFLGARVGLAVMTIVVLIAPMVRSARGTGSETTRLLLLPIRRTMLHGAEVIGALSDPWLGVIFPALVLFPLGLVIGGSVVGGLVALGGALLFITILMLAVSLASFLIALLFRKRKRAEMFTAVLIVVLSLSGLLFSLAGERWENRIEERREARSAGIEDAVERDPSLLASQHVDNKLPLAAAFVPSESFAHLVDAGIAGRGAEAGLHFVVLLSWTGLLYVASRSAYSRLLETPETGGASGKMGAGFHTRRLPGVRPAVAAVAFATMRLALRTVRGKTAVYLNFVITAMIYVILKGELAKTALPNGLSYGLGIGFAGGFFTLISLQPILANVFAVDSHGLTLQLLSPLSTADLLRGKIIGCALLVTISTALCFGIGFVLDPAGSPVLWFTSLMILASTFLLFIPLALLLSAVFPKVADLSRMGKDGNPQPIAGFVAFLAVPLLVFPPGAAAFFTLMVAKSTFLTAGIILAWLAICLGVYALTMRALVSLFERRRENLLLVATGR